MSGVSSNAAAWSTLLALLDGEGKVAGTPRSPDDPRLAELIESWTGALTSLAHGRCVLLGFPQDEGVRRNGGRVGAANAPEEIRRWLQRLTPWDPASDTGLSANPPLDLGNVRITGPLEDTQANLGGVVAGVLGTGAVPIVLGGGHETVFGVYLGHVAANTPVGIVNLDAHLDVRPLKDGLAHSGSPFRQMLEHPTHPLPGERYVCLGAQPQAVSRAHWRFARERGCVIRWCHEVRGSLVQHLECELARLAALGCSVHLTIDADVVRMADVPGVSAPNPVGLPGEEVVAAARLAGRSPAVVSLDLVEINPRQDRDGQSARWAAVVLWNFLMGKAERSSG